MTIARDLTAIRSDRERDRAPDRHTCRLAGTKLRLGTFAEGRIELAPVLAFTSISIASAGDESRAPLPHPEIFEALRPGTELLLDDGRVRLQVEDCGSRLRRHAVLWWAAPCPTAKGSMCRMRNCRCRRSPRRDRADLSFALEHGADWIAFSFVQRPADVAEGRKLVGGRAGVMVKLEKPSAIQHLAEIIELADGLMVARGDLGVEMPPEDVPSVQKQVIHACRVAGKPVVVATQMLESMIAAPTPTRAEASDVATAVYEGADAVMLSAETAAGRYPIEAVAMMDRIACRVQEDPLYSLDARRFAARA